MKKKIELCDQCEGIGTIDHSELIDYHKRDYKYWKENCSKCKGSGLLEITTTIETKPYKPAEIKDER